MAAQEARFMAQALKLARRTEGRTAPNPPVGAVVVRGGEVVGRGWHQKVGRPHAETVALEAAGGLAEGADLFVTLEPCNHYGRTPPCTEAIISAGIKRVIIGCLDPNPWVTGRGSQRLRRAGIEVGVGLLGQRCQELIRPFERHSTTGRPWVCLKMAASLDGRTATGPGKSQWLTGPEAKTWVHRLRNRCEAILVGRGTVVADDPLLTARLSVRSAQNPLRVVLDSKLSLSPKARVIAGPKKGGPAGGGCLILTTDKSKIRKRAILETAGAEVKVLPAREGRVDLEAALAELGRRGVMRLLIEGGPEVAGACARAELLDEIFFIFAPLLINGAGAPGLLTGARLKGLEEVVKLSAIKVQRLGSDLLIEALVSKKERGGACSPD